MQRRLSLALAIMAAIAISFVASAQSPRFSPSPYVYKIRIGQCKYPPALRIQTGFRVKGLEGIVTALHGVVGCDSVVAQPIGGAKPYRDLIIGKVDIDRDVALLWSEEIESELDVGLDSASPVSGDDYLGAYLLGYPKDIISQRILKNVEIIDTTALGNLLPTVELDAMAARGSPSIAIEVLAVQSSFVPGHSGAPLLDRDGRVIGIANGGLDLGRIDMAWAIPWDGIQWEMVSSQVSQEVSMTDLERLKDLETLDPNLLFAFEKQAATTISLATQSADTSLPSVQSPIDPAAQSLATPDPRASSTLPVAAPTPPSRFSVVFASNRDDPDPSSCGENCNWEIYLRRSDNLLTNLTKHAAGDVEPICAPNGKNISFQSNRNGEESTLGLYVMQIDGSNPIRLTADGDYPYLRSLAWSPDGEKIAFAPSFRGDIYLVNSDGTGKEQLTYNENRYWSMSWSPDGKKLAFISKLDDSENYAWSGNENIFIVSSDGNIQSRITRDQIPFWAIAWSPDGDYILAVRGFDRDLYVMRPDGTELLLLARNVAITDCNAPSWSPDSQRIVYVSDRSGTKQIYTIRRDGTDVRQLTGTWTDEETDNYDPRWSPDGRRILFVSERDGNPEIYSMNPLGTNESRLTESFAKDTCPSWCVEPASVNVAVEPHTEILTDSVSHLTSNMVLTRSSIITAQNAKQLSLLHAFDIEPGWGELVFSKNGEFLSFGTIDGETLIWHLEDYSVFMAFSQAGLPRHMFSDTNALLASLPARRDTRSFNPDGTAGVLEFQTPFVEVSPLESMIAACYPSDGVVKYWTVEVSGLRGSENVLSLPSGFVAEYGCILAFTPDERYLVVADGIVYSVYDLHSMDTIATFDGVNFSNMDISRDGRYLAEGGVLFETKNWTQVRQFPTSDIVTRVAFSPDSGLLATGAQDGNVQIWQINNGTLVATINGTGQYPPMAGLAFSPDGHVLAVATDKVRLYSVSD